MAEGHLVREKRDDTDRIFGDADPIADEKRMPSETPEIYIYIYIYGGTRRLHGTTTRDGNDGGTTLYAARNFVLHCRGGGGPVDDLAAAAAARRRALTHATGRRKRARPGRRLLRGPEAFNVCGAVHLFTRSVLRLISYVNLKNKDIKTLF